MNYDYLFFILIAAHFVCDFPLQGDFLARAKDPTNPIPGVPWSWCMLAHGMIHAGAVYVVLGSYTCAMLELVAHQAIDIAKCGKKINFWQDQMLHILCKMVWFMFVFPG
jgi:hypothetical protein